jgi:tetratricopeptide (TPR) repeat protein
MDAGLPATFVYMHSAAAYPQSLGSPNDHRAIMIENRHSTLTLALLAICLTSGCSRPNEADLFQQAKVYAGSGEYAKAESLLANMIATFPRSPHIDIYYQSAFAVLKMHKDSLHSTEIAKKRRAVHDSSKSEPRGTINLKLYASEPTAEQQAVRSNIVQLGEDYLAHHPHGGIASLAKRELLDAYAGSRTSRFFELAQSVADSGELQDRAWATYYLALYARADGKYKEASSYFLSFVELSPDSSSKAEGFLYTADCLYMIGDITASLAYLDRVQAIEPAKRDRFLSDMARIWRPIYVKVKQSPLLPRQVFVHVYIG